MKVAIPMAPGTDSLNVAVAAALATYTLTRPR
jgi:tRNA G18 (ribose-2'-O)-methylase SpoU